MLSQGSYQHMPDNSPSTYNALALSVQVPCCICNGVMRCSGCMFHASVYLSYTSCLLLLLPAGLLQVRGGPCCELCCQTMLIGIERRGWVLSGRGEEEEGRGQAAGGCSC